MKSTIFIFLLLVTMSCQNSERKQIEQLVKEWTDRKSFCPKDLSSPASPLILIQPARYKVIVFVDSVGCISCKLQLPKWKDLINEVDSLSETDIPFLFFFQTKNVSEIRHILRCDNFANPVCIDTADDLYKLNRFPSNMMFQTFLVDAGNRVKVIGNPIHNLSVKELYLKEIAGIKSTAWSVTIIQLDSTEYHYDTVGENETVDKRLHSTMQERKCSA